jgi:hypothetical protein
MILQSQMYLWVILVVKLKQYHYQELLQLQYWISSYCDDAVTTAKILDGTILAADIAADAVTAKILDGDSSR